MTFFGAEWANPAVRGGQANAGNGWLRTVTTSATDNSADRPRVLACESPECAAKVVWVFETQRGSNLADRQLIGLQQLARFLHLQTLMMNKG